MRFVFKMIVFPFWLLTAFLALMLKWTLNQMCIRDRYGRLRRTYLMNHRPVLYNTMLLNGSLYPHLMEVEQTAESRMQQTWRSC